MLQEYEDRLNLGSRVTFVSSHPYDLLRAKTIRLYSGIIFTSEDFDFGKAFSTFVSSILSSIFVKRKDGIYTLR